MNRIASFEVDHDLLEPGLYISRIDADIVTYDLRTRKPNSGDYMDNIALHTVEHMMATYLRNSKIGEEVIYFGPMGCRTGFYLIVTDSPTPSEVKNVLIECLNLTINHEGKVFGASRKECGNYMELDLEKAKAECARYLKVLLSLPEDTDFKYKRSD